jgi:cobalt/nickel transport system permease protein
MHMADALLSPAVGGTMWAATAGITYYSARKLKQEMDDRKLPLMGVLGAFVFAAQMINFTIPATGSSGHLAGGMILAILLGPYAAFLTMASVITVQALFFADGGLLALGCNIFNMGFFACFVAYPLIYKKLVGEQPTQGRILLGAIAAAILSLQMGAFGVVLETMFSGISDLPFTTFLLLMQPIHLAIGVVEGLVTATVVAFVWKARPEILEMAPRLAPGPSPSLKPVILGLVAVAVLTGGPSPGSPPPIRTAWSGPSRGSPARRRLKRPRPGPTGSWPRSRRSSPSFRTMISKSRQGKPRPKKKRAGPTSTPANPWRGCWGASSPCSWWWPSASD